MRLALLIPSLGPGGAERVMTLLAAGLATRGHHVWLVTLAPVGDDFFAMDPRVRRIGLDLMVPSTSVVRALHANAQRVLALRGVIAAVDPDAVVSFLTSMNVLAVLACAGLRPRIVVSERIDPASHRVDRFWAGLRALVYRRADAIVVQTEAAAEWFRRRLGKRPIISVLPNPVALDDACQSCAMQVPKPFLLGAGRLVPQKGFDILIRAFATVANDCGALTLVIAGEGPEAESLRDLVLKLRLERRVLFLGQVKKLGVLMRQAEVFVLPSRYEGFPNVLLEALARGVPVVATDCPSGPREILRDGEFGLLVPCEDVGGLADALRRIATDVDLRKRFSTTGRLAAAPYAADRVVARWEELLLASSC